MGTTVYILMQVNLSEGADCTPELKGIYGSNKAARDNAICLLCGKAAEWDIPEDNIDTDNLRLADATGTRCIQMGLNEAVLFCDARFSVR